MINANGVKRGRTLQVVFGGQWGSEGKGQVVAKLVDEHRATSDRKLLVVRVGGPNAGHTAIDAKGNEIKAQSIPIAAFTDHDAMNAIGPGGVLDMAKFHEEYARLESIWGKGNTPIIILDPYASVISEEDVAAETKLKSSIGSTGEGVGAATAAKVMRRGKLLQDWANENDLPHNVHVRDLPDIANSSPFDVIIEGTQGYLLSLNTSRYYPYVTSRDCGPEAILGQCGITPRAFDHAHMVAVFRTYPIRVGGNSGPLPQEITWDDVQKESKGYVTTPERTTVTKKIRRVARWDWSTVLRTLKETSPTEIALSFLDYLVPSIANSTSRDAILENQQARGVLQSVEGMVKATCNARVTLVGTGKGQAYTVRVKENLPTLAESLMGFERMKAHLQETGRDRGEQV